MTGSINILDYKLPCCDVDEEKRNFPGYDKDEYFTLEEIVKGDRWGGMTETDEDTSGKVDGPYSKMQMSKQKPHVPVKSSAKGKRYNSEKPSGFKSAVRSK